MDTRWRIMRIPLPQLDGQRRWDYAYQLLVHWATELDALSKTTSINDQEEANGSCPVYTGIDGSPATDPDD